MVVGDDRVREFEVLTSKYNGKEARHGFYNFESIEIVSAGARDPDSDDVSGMSASKQRKAAADNDFAAFSQGVPSNVNTSDARKLFNDLRKGMGLEESTDFKARVEFEPVSEQREQYIRGELVNIGDYVVVDEEVAEVIMLGTNYVITEMSDGRRLRKWIHDVEPLLERQDPDIKDREGTQPAKYHSGLAKSTKVARDRQFKKQTKMADDDPAAYKPAPGDKDAKTKLSKYTQKYRQQFSEAINKGVQKKADQTGIPYSILKKVFDRGVAAWKTGHRPGTTPQQWGMARVNAFIVKKKKGTLNHDKDLA